MLKKKKTSQWLPNRIYEAAFQTGLSEENTVG
jgi:hypothetical protein